MLFLFVSFFSLHESAYSSFADFSDAEEGRLASERAAERRRAGS